jgi:hypothetical protein
LRNEGLQELALSAPANLRAVDRSAAVAALSLFGASCLERSVVLQRFDAAAGRPRDVIIGVTAPGAAFRAHAWLQGEHQRDGALHEITRRPTPPE